MNSGAVLSLSWCLFFCFIVYNGHTLCLSNVISPINVSGKFTLENASLYEDLTYCTCTCFVLFHIKCVDMSIFLLRGMLNNTGITRKHCSDGSVCLTERLNEWYRTVSAFFSLFAWYSWSLSAMHRGSSIRVTVTCHRLSNHSSDLKGQGGEEPPLLCWWQYGSNPQCCSLYRELKKKS